MMTLGTVVTQSDLDDKLKSHENVLISEMKKILKESHKEVIASEVPPQRNADDLYTDKTPFADEPSSVSPTMEPGIPAGRLPLNLNVKRHFRKISLGYEADQDSDSGLRCTSPYIPSLPQSTHKVTKRNNNIHRKHLVKPSMEKENTSFESGENTDALIDRTMSLMEAEGALDFNSSFDTTSVTTERLDTEGSHNVLDNRVVSSTNQKSTLYHRHTGNEN